MRSAPRGLDYKPAQAGARTVSERRPGRGNQHRRERLDPVPPRLDRPRAARSLAAHEPLEPPHDVSQALAVSRRRSIGLGRGCGAGAVRCAAEEERGGLLPRWAARVEVGEEAVTGGERASAPCRQVRRVRGKWGRHDTHRSISTLQSTARETARSASPAAAWTASSLLSHARRTISDHAGGTVGEGGPAEGEPEAEAEGAERARADRAAERTRWFRGRDHVEGCRAHTAAKTWRGRQRVSGRAGRGRTTHLSPQLLSLAHGQCLDRLGERGKREQHAMQLGDVLRLCERVDL